MPDGALRVAGGDVDRAARATFEPNPMVPDRGTWAGPWETDRCPHGRLYSYRWTVRGMAQIRPTLEDFESSEPEYGRNGCSKCDADRNRED